MTWCGNPDGILSSGWLTSAYPGLGILGSDIPSTGDNGGSPVLNDGINPAHEYRWKFESFPSAGTLTSYEDLTFEFSGAPDGIYSAVYRLWDNGVDQGTATLTLQVGPSHITISAATASAVGSMAISQTAVVVVNATTGAATFSGGASSGASMALINAATASVQASIAAHGYAPPGMTLTPDDIAAIVSAVLAALNATTGGRTLGQHLQIQTAVLAGETTGTGTTHIAFNDGAVTVEADVPAPGAVGDRQNVTISGV